MDNAIYSLSSAAYRYNIDLSVQAGNLANINTEGYQESKSAHPFVLKSHGKDATAFPVEGPILVNFEQGPIVQTGRSLDVAIVGQGFFKIQTPQGIRYSRSGRFMVNSESVLVDANQNPVLSNDGQQIVFEDTDSDITINGDGSVLASGQDRGQIGFVQFSDLRKMEKLGKNLYRTDQAELEADQASLIQGSIELANSNSIKAVTDIMELQRLQELNAKMISEEFSIQRAAIKSYSKIGG